MIKTKSDLQYYLEADMKFYPKMSNSLKRLKHIFTTSPINCQTEIWKYVKCVRYLEYHQNNSVLCNTKNLKSMYHTLLMFFYNYKLKKISYRTGFQIPPNVCGPGLLIFHYGYLIINGKTKIGANCILYPGIEIGSKEPTKGCPVIGDNCFIGAGAKIFGPIEIGSNVTIAANAVVVKDIPDNCVVGGVPAKIIKHVL